MSDYRDPILAEDVFAPHRASALDRGAIARALRIRPDAEDLLEAAVAAALQDIAARAGLRAADAADNASPEIRAKLFAALAGALSEIAEAKTRG